MGFFQNLFGGSTQTQEPVDTTPRELQALRRPFASTLSNLFGRGTPGAAFKGIPGAASLGYPTAPAPLGANESAILAGLMTQEQPALNLINRTLAGEYLPGGPGSNPFLQEAIAAAQRSTFAGLEDVLTRALPGRFTAAGQFTNPQGSSAFDMAARLAARDAGQTAADIASGLSFAGYESERGRQQQAVQLSQEQINTTLKNLQAQALPRLIQELGIERGLEEYRTRVNAILQALSVASGAPIAQQGATATGTSQTGIVPAIGNLVGNLPIASR